MKISKIVSMAIISFGLDSPLYAGAIWEYNPDLPFEQQPLDASQRYNPIDDPKNSTNYLSTINYKLALVDIKYYLESDKKAVKDGFDSLPNLSITADQINSQLNKYSSIIDSNPKYSDIKSFGKALINYQYAKDNPTDPAKLNGNWWIGANTGIMVSYIITEFIGNKANANLGNTQKTLNFTPSKGIQDIEILKNNLPQALQAIQLSQDIFNNAMTELEAIAVANANNTSNNTNLNNQNSSVSPPINNARFSRSSLRDNRNLSIANLSANASINNQINNANLATNLSTRQTNSNNNTNESTNENINNSSNNENLANQNNTTNLAANQNDNTNTTKPSNNQSNSNTNNQNLNSQISNTNSVAANNPIFSRTILKNSRNISIADLSDNANKITDNQENNPTNQNQNSTNTSSNENSVAANNPIFSRTILKNSRNISIADLSDNANEITDNQENNPTNQNQNSTNTSSNENLANQNNTTTQVNPTNNTDEIPKEVQDAIDDIIE
ncbi:hypothetical protein V2I29_07785, partial [Campylobacter sp. CX2-8023-23]|uniref:hypothetical protein n=1 Tax=Campylobacter porcelli TaxID=1660073 RepID=UPI002EABDFE4|nr:hypothetical protein [Campylobacter sp. CX2-8023-23]